MKILLNPEQWENLVEGEILDPDGWDRTDGKFEADWLRPISFEIFLAKADQSTTDGFNFIPESELTERVSSNLSKCL